jgi:mannose-1-phosphate guanylyltransferase/mannose-6-phosphate isomerase
MSLCDANWSDVVPQGTSAVPTATHDGALRVAVQPVVMAGGAGTRLWPLSREQYPKQFLALHGRHTLLQEAVLRAGAAGLPGQAAAPPIVVGNEAHRFMLLEQLRELGLADAPVVLEPCGRNTAPALTLAALQAQETGADPVLVVAPSDHAFTDGAAYAAAVRAAVAQAAGGAICLLGISADRPETGYGYIAAASREDASTGLGVLDVERFEEKPDLETAMQYVAAGGYWWNSGLFVLRASVWLAALTRHEPATAAACRAAWKARRRDGSFVRPDAEAFAAVPSSSIDVAVIERCVGGPSPLRMLPLRAGWSDLGAWESVWQVASKDAHGNAARGDTLLHDARNVLVHATHRLVSVVGLDDVVVVETPDAVLVSSRSGSQQIKQVVSTLAARARTEHTLHRRVQRPWGWYDSVDQGGRFQVKRICVKPGAALSLQMHYHRAEHWVVVSGTAEVTCGDDRRLVGENQSTYIPLGQRHRLANPGKVPLEIIEVQSGSYLGEDDIVRFDDAYGRG